MVLVDRAAEYLRAVDRCIERQDDLRVVTGRLFLAGLVQGDSCSGLYAVSNDIMAVTFNHRAYSPVLRQSHLRANATVPWLQNRRIRFQFT